ncbi:MAG: hypothetical protein AABX51_00490 [Nanoarchaeota archaeon]
MTEKINDPHLEFPKYFFKSSAYLATLPFRFPSVVRETYDGIKKNKEQSEKVSLPNSAESAYYRIIGKVSGTVCGIAAIYVELGIAYGAISDLDDKAWIIAIPAITNAISLRNENKRSYSSIDDITDSRKQ